MPENFKTELFDSKYLDELELMIFALYEEDPAGEKITTEKIERTIITLEQYPEKGRIELLLIDEHIVGYSVLVKQWSNEYGGDFLVVDEIYVKPDWRDQGVGSQYIKKLETEASKYVGLQLEVTEQNKSAEKLYRSLGFEQSRNLHMLKVFS